MSHRIIDLRIVQGERFGSTGQLDGFRGRFIKTTVGLTTNIIRKIYKCNFS
jgi:hypothetical protein